MIIDSKYTKSFQSNDLTDAKYDEIHKLAVELLDFRNIVSLEVANNLLFYTEMSKFEFMSFLTNKFKHYNISSNFYRAIYIDIYKAYENKINKVKEKINFYKINSTTEYYKRRNGSKKAGDFNRFKITKKTTHLTNILTHLAKYGKEDTLEYYKERTNGDDLYSKIIYYSEKFTYKRLYKLAILKRTNVLRKYNNPVVFKSLNFRGRSRTKDIISYNYNEKSIMKAFITLSWLKRGDKMIIPVKYSKEHYGNMTNYHKNTSDYEYVLTFTNRGKIKINICIDGEREIPNNEGYINKYVGVDVNIKHNLFSLSDAKTFDYDRKLVNEIAKEFMWIDELKKDKDYKVGKKKQRKIDSMKNVLKHSNEKLISDVCKYMVGQGYQHAIFEDLNNSFGKNWSVKDDIKTNRKASLLNLSSLKDEFEHISRKYGIAFSTIHPEYTSKCCSKCGCIHNDNRLSQEEFKCVKCGYNTNADVNSAINIKNRASLTVLKELLKQDADLKTFSPKKFRRGYVLEFLNQAFPLSQANA